MRRTLKIISGGQTGADIAALRAASKLGIPTGGVAPSELISKHKLGEYGITPFVYPGRNASLTERLVGRSMKNVDMAEAVVAFRPGPSVGTDKTIAYATSHRWKDFVMPKMDKNFTISTSYKPTYLIIDMHDPDGCADGIVSFIKKTKARVINVCGPREFKDVPDYEQRVEAILRIAFSACT